MNKNEIVGYNLLAKRAIETESGVNIDEALRNITAYKLVAINGNTGKPETTWGVSDKILYITQSGQNQYRQWIWNGTFGWICIGETSSPDSWKKWSEDHGSSSTVDGSVYIGPENEIDRPNTYVLGKGNKVTKNADTVEIADTDVVSLGTNNEVINGANAYQLGRDNKVIGNNLSSISSYPEQVAINIGQGNTVKDAYGSDGYNGEGVNIGKNNTSSMFGISIGQNNAARGGSVVIGENLNGGDYYATTIIGHEKQCYTVSDFEQTPVMNGVPLGKYELIDFRTIGHEVSNAWFDANGKPIEIKRYYVVVNGNTDEVKFEEDNDNYYITYTSSKYGYIDDNGFLVDSNEATPSGKVKATYYPYYSTRDQGNFFWGTTYYTRYINLDEFTPVIWKTYKLSEVSQYFITSSLGNVYISDTEAYAKSYDNGGFILYKVRVTGKDVDGVFTPWFNNNFELSECTTRDFYPSELSYSSNITVPNNIAIKINEETTGKSLTDVMYGGTLFGPLATVEYGGIGITQTHGDYIRLKYTALPGYKTVNSTKYYLNGSSSASTSSTFCTVDNVDVLTPSGILNIIKPIVHNGAVGIAAMTGDYNDSIDDYNNLSTNLEVGYGAIGIGDRMYVDSGAIGIGRNQMGIGGGSLALGIDNKWGTSRYNCSYGATLIGRYNTASYDSGLLHGATVVGNNNYFDNYAGGAVLLGNYNRFANYSGGYGSVLVGVNSSIKGSGSIAIGTGYSGGGGAHARYGAVAISYKGAIADCGSTALGGNGCVAFYGAASMGWNGCTAMYGGLSLGWTGIMSIYGSVAIGHDGVCGLYGGYAMGWSGSCAQFGSISLGYYGAFARNGAMAIGHHGVNAYDGAIALGYNNAYADNGGIAIGMQTVKGKNGSIAIGLCGTYAESGSVSIGHKSNAFYGSMSLVFNNTTGPDYSFQVGNSIFVQYAMPDEYGRKQFVYPEFRVLKGLPVRVDRIYAPNGNLLDTIENPSNGKYSVYKSNTGKYYDNLSGIPSNEWMKIWIRATKDENNVIVPFRGMETNFAKIQRIVDNWIEVPISRTGDPQVGECAIVNHPSLPELEMDCSTYGGITIGGKAFAANGAVSIGTDNCQNNWSVTDTSVTVDGNSVREYTRRAGYTNNDRFYPWGAFQAYAKNDSVAIGSSVIATGASIAMGISPVIADYGSLALSYGGLNTYDESENDDIYGKAEGNSLLICGMDNTGNIIRRGFSRSKSIAIGTGINASNQAIAIGDRSYASNNASAIGTCSTASNQSYSMGDNASADRRSVSIGAYSRTTDASIAIGDDNEAGLNAFAIGTKNLSYGWSILYGVDNKTPRESGAHATIIGYKNESTSNLEKLEKTLRVKYDKQTAINKEVARYNTVHDAELALMRPYILPSEYDKVVSYDQSLFNYYVNGGPTPSYDQEYWDIKNGLVNYPEVIMTESQWYDWYEGYSNAFFNMYYACDYYYYYTLYHDSWYWDYYVQYRDYAYEYLPAFLQLMLDYATENMSNDTVAVIQEAIDAIADKPEIVTDEIMSIYYNYYYSDFGRLVNNVFYESYSNRSSATAGKIPSKKQGEYKEYDAEATSLLYVIQNIRNSGSSGVYIDEVEEVPCNSVIMGSGNTSNHYNSVLIGSNNESLAPLSEKSKTDDDGFTFALGYHNKVERNYDIAIGYMSEARGGENIAIQHSVAGNGNKTYHNLAMFDSSAMGTGNVAMQHAEVKSGYRNMALFDSTIEAGVLNIAHGNSKLICSGNGHTNNMLLNDSVLEAVGNSYLQYNSLFDSVVTASNCLFQSRFFATTATLTLNSEGNSHNDFAMNKHVHLNASGSFDRNIIFGNTETTYTAGTICRNIFANNNEFWSPVSITASTIADTILWSAGVQLTTTDLTDTLILNSMVSGNSDEFVASVVMGRSRVFLNTTDDMSYNFIFDSNLSISGQSAGNSGSHNVLFDCTAYNVSDSFCFGFGNTAYEDSTQSLAQSYRTVTFGDGNISDCVDTFHFGSNNKVSGLHDTIVFGRYNEIHGNGHKDSSGSLRIFGSNNDVGTYVNSDNIIGNGNVIHALSDVLCGAENNSILGNDNTIDSDHSVAGNSIIGSSNTITGVQTDFTLLDNAAEVATLDHPCAIKVSNNSSVPTGEIMSSIYSDYYYFFSNNTLVREYNVAQEYKAISIEVSGATLVSRFNAGTLVDGAWYHTTSYQGSANIPEGFILWSDRSYYYDGNTVVAMSGNGLASHVFNNAIIGYSNTITSNVAGYTILGGGNRVSYDNPQELTECISQGLVQGNDNLVKNGSNIVSMGNGNVSTGHNSVAIGSQLISNQWQTVIGKYNSPIAGPNRLDTENPQDATKALFIIGNGYSEKDDEDWKEEEYITRSNAMVVYADGTVRAKKFVSDEPELELVEGTGIHMTTDMSAGTRTISVTQDVADLLTFLNTKPSTGTYAINSVNGVLTWVQIGSTQV